MNPEQTLRKYFGYDHFRPGITLVISPLISLMQDQVKALNEAGIHQQFSFRIPDYQSAIAHRERYI